MNLMEQQAFERLEIENEILRSDIQNKDKYIEWLEKKLDEYECETEERK